jgi:hypothetical protein
MELTKALLLKNLLQSGLPHLIILLELRSSYLHVIRKDHYTFLNQAKAKRQAGLMKFPIGVTQKTFNSLSNQTSLEFIKMESHKFLSCSKRISSLQSAKTNN